jgi:RHS repeat-associated protein
VGWNPTVGQIGEHTVAVRVIDSLGAFSGQEFTLTVNGNNTPSQILSNPITNAGVNSEYRYQLTAVDLEADPLKYELGRRPAGMVIDANGLITWTPTISQVGTQTIDILVTDSQGAVTKQTYNLVVGSTPINGSSITNNAPRITSQPIFGADTAKRYEYQVVGNDPENGTLTYSLIAAPVGMVIDAVTGLISWDTPVIGNTQVVVKVTDGGGLASVQGYTLATKQNHVPVISSTPQTKVVVGNSYRYDVVAADIDGDALTYTLDSVSKGLGVSIDNLGRISWKPSAANVGIHPVTVQVKDTLGAVATQVFNLEVAADDPAPTIKLVRGSNFANIGDTVTFQVQATDNVGIRNRQLLVNNQAITLDSNGVGTYTMTAAGVVNVSAIVTDVNGNVSNSSTTVTVLDPTDVEAPIVSVNFPTTNITGITDIIGSINDSNLDYYVLEVAPVGTEDYKEVFRGTSAVTNGVLGKFDPTNLVNDTYTLRLTAFDTGGHGTVVDREVAVTGDLKLGNFRLSFTDITVPVTGIPITLTRTYDTLTSKTQDAFGYGWRMEFRDTQLRTSLKRDETFEELGYRTVGFSEGDRVYITLPGGKREGFTFRPAQLGVGATDNSLLATYINGVFGGKIYKPTFVADKGNTSTLTVPGSNFHGSGGDAWLLQVPGKPGKYVTIGGLLYRPDEQIFGNEYTVTTKDGTVYKINASTGKLNTVADTNGNTLTYTDAEIKSSNGQKVVFERDNQGRIVSVTDPLGAKVKYEYDAKGDLVAVIDRDGNTTKYEYNSTQQHYLDKIIDPLGREAVKTEYDAQGKLKKTTNAGGNGVELIYDPANSIEVVKDALGNATTYEYDGRGNVVTEVDALGGITRRNYDDANNLLSETDAEGRKNTYTYDEQKNQLSRTDANGNVYRYTYGIHGRIASSVDPLGNTTTYTLDGKGNPLTKTNALGEVTTYTYDGYGNQTSVINALGQTVYSQYDRSGNLIQETDALGHVTKYTYDGRGNRLTETKTVTTPTGIRTLVDTKTYDKNGNVTSWRDAEGNLIQYEYNAANKQTLVIDALGRRTISRYDDNDRLIETVFADGLSNRFTYDANGKKTQSIDREGHITTFQYDAAGRSTALISPDDTPNNPNDNPRKLLEYDKAGWLKAIVDEQGNRQEWIYDAARNQTGSRSYVGNTPITTNNIYDAAGRKVSTTDPLGNITRYAYDSLGRLVETRYADGLTSKTAYDAIGNEIAKVDRANHQTKYEYDALQHLIAVVDPTNSRTSYNYDELGDLIAETDANGHQTKYEYDGLQRRTAVIRPLGQRSTTAYDKASNVISYTDFNGQTTNYAYGLGNLLTGKQLSDGSQTSITYSATGKRQSVMDSRGTTSYTYNAQGQITKVANPDGQQISYAYDSQGHLSRITTTAGTTTYAYGAFNRLQQVTDSQGGITAYTYDLAGNLVNTRFANGITETRWYDSLNRLVSVTNTNAQSQIVSSYAYVLDAVGNKLQSLENSGRKVDYIYDTRDRLLSEKITDAMSGNRTIAYTYDAVGNRLTLSDSVAGDTSYSYNENDWLVKETHLGEQTQYTYDNNGSLLSKFHNASDKMTYAWNLDHQLSEVQIINAISTHQSTYTYDVDGNRVSQTVNGVGTNYLVDTNRGLAQVAVESDSQGVKASYTYAGGVISQTSSNVQSFYINDGHSGVRLVTNNNGSVINAYSYDGYGNLLQSVGGTTPDRYRGEARDSQTELQYLRARYYDSSNGRFLSVDPFEGMTDNPVSRHRYLYGNSNPITYSDPSGNFSMAEVTQTTALASVLAILGTISFASTLTRIRDSGPIKWNGQIILGLDVDSSIVKSLTGFDIELGFGGYVLEATSDEIFYNSGVYRYTNTWAILSATTDLGTLPEDSSALVEVQFPNEAKNVKLFSPRFFGANGWTFSGQFLAGEVQIPGNIDTSGFSIGIGVGYYVDQTSSFGVQLKAGISFPTFGGTYSPS